MFVENMILYNTDNGKINLDNAATHTYIKLLNIY